MPEQAKPTADPDEDGPSVNEQADLGGRAVRGSAWAVLGFGLTQVLRLGSNAALTRLLPPTAYGLMALVGIVLQCLQMFSDLGLKPSIVRSPRGGDPVFINTAWTLQVIRGAALWAVACLVTWPVARIYDQPSLLTLLPVAALTALLMGFHSTSLATLNRALMLGRLTTAELGAQILAIVVMITWAMISPSVWALAVGGLVNAGAMLIFSHTLLPGIRNRFRMEREARVELVGFGRWVFISTGFSFLMQQGDRIILSTLVPVAMLGIYSTAAQLAAVSSSLLGNVSSRVLLPLYARLLERGPDELRRGVARARLMMMAAMFPIPAALAGFGDMIVRVLLGSEFHDAGWMLQLLALPAMVDALTVTIWPVILAFGDSYRYMIQVIVRMVLATAGMIIGFQIGDLQGLIIGLAVGQAAGYPALVWAMWPSRTWLPLLDVAGVVYGVVLIWVMRALAGWVEPLLAGPLGL